MHRLLADYEAHARRLLESLLDRPEILFTDSSSRKKIDDTINIFVKINFKVTAHSGNTLMSRHVNKPRSK